MQNRHTVAVCALWLIGIASYSSAEPQELSLANGDRYEGEVIDGSLEGFGRYVWADGKSYEGNFAAGKREGFGSLTWVNGDRYRGNFVTGQMQGRGVFVWANGDRYEGSFVANQRDGQGTMQWQSGERYEGQFEAGMMNGQGLYQWPMGPLQGTFVQDRRSGLGMLIDSDAATFSGYFFRVGVMVWVLSAGQWPMSLQQWQDGVLQEAQAIASDPDAAPMMPTELDGQSRCLHQRTGPRRRICDHPDRRAFGDSRSLDTWPASQRRARGVT